MRSPSSNLLGFATILTVVGALSSVVAVPSAHATSRATTAREAAEDLLDAGSLALVHGHFGDAVSQLTRCISVDRTLAECPRALGIAYSRMGEETKAARYFRIYLNLTPAAPDAERVRRLLAAFADDAAADHG